MFYRSGLNDSSYKKTTPFETRCNETTKIIQKYPDRVPIYIENDKNCRFKISKHKFLVPIDLTFGQFLMIVRQHIDVNPNEALFIFIGNSNFVALGTYIGTVYRKFKDEDGYLYIRYKNENTFG